MKSQSTKPVTPITDRTFEFSIRIVNLSRTLAKNSVDRILGSQLLRSGTSIGANIEEAQAAHSKAEFVSKSGIALKEAHETHYWLRLIAAADPKLQERLTGLIQEAKEIRDILGTITSKARRNARK